MTEKEFTELFGTHDEHYIRIGDLKKILVTGEVLVYDFLLKHKNKICGDRTYSYMTRAIREVFGNEWENTLTFEKLIENFRKITYLKGIGKRTLCSITKMCILNERKISSEMQRYNTIEL